MLRSFTSTLLLASTLSCGPQERTEPEVDSVHLAGLTTAQWQRLSIQARETRTVSLRLQPNIRHMVEWSDRHGYGPQMRRPACVLDVKVTDRQYRTLAGPAHNSQYTPNGLTPDALEFVSPSDGKVWLEFSELDGVGDRFEVRFSPITSGAEPPSGLRVYRAGATTDVTTTSVGGFLLAGGGTDVDAATEAMVRASGGGDVVILRMDDTGGGYATYFVEHGAHRANELVFDAPNGNGSVSPNRIAELRGLVSSPWVTSLIDSAEVVFLAGGNQTKYVEVFQNTPLALAIERLVARRGILGGTSAGMHSLTGWVHTPTGDGNSVTSAQALADPFIRQNEFPGTAALDFTTGPFRLPGWENVITDTHWSQRDRRGRSVVFLARAIEQGFNDMRLIACDEGAALFVNSDRTTRVYGPPGRGASFLKALGAPSTCADNRPLDWPVGVREVRVESGGTFDLNQWQSTSAQVSLVTVRQGQLQSRNE
jgi:cyanophycinase